MSLNKLLANLDEAQAQAAAAIRGPVAIIAGAGSGKTRTITHRLAYAIESGVVDPQRILAVTFTTKAAGEMRSRMAELGYPGLNARTFHSAALRQLMYFWPQTVGTSFPEIISNKFSLLAESINSAGIELSADRTSLRDYAGEIEWAKVQEFTPSEYLAAASKANRLNGDNEKLTKVAELYKNYENNKITENKMDFEDILTVLAGMLEEERFVRESIRDQYRYFTVDEYQDISPLSYKVLNLWLGNREEICVVGDPAQTIYSFSGASNLYLQQFANRYPNAQIYNLDRSYRSTPQIISLASQILLQGTGKYNSEVSAMRKSGAAPIFYQAASDGAEENYVVAEIKKLAESGVPLSQIAVLARTNAQLESLQIELTRNGIDNDGVGSLGSRGERFFDRKEVKEAIRDIRNASVLAEKGENWRDELHGILRPYANEDFIKSINFLADNLHERGARSLRELLRELEEGSANNNPPLYPGVHLATLHAAKGLEWPHLFIIGASDNYLPFNRPWIGAEGNLTESFIEEERRLLYVGVTRAAKTLRISYVGTISRFLRGLDMSAKNN